MNTRYNFQPRFKVVFPSREEWLRNEIKLTGEVFYTDGSKIGSNTGAGVFREDGGIRIYDSLGGIPTVYQMELYAIVLCLEEIQKERIEYKNIYIISDSQAALKSLNKEEITSKLVWDCIQGLNFLGIKKSHLNRMKLISDATCKSFNLDDETA